MCEHQQMKKNLKKLAQLVIHFMHNINIPYDCGRLSFWGGIFWIF